MTHTAPHFGNLKARAKALSLVITKAADASLTGQCEYVLHSPSEDWETIPMLSLYGIRANIEKLESVRDQPASAAKVETLKQAERYTEAGAAAFEANQPSAYGQHFGMRSDLSRARLLFAKGYHAAAWEAENAKA